MFRKFITTMFVAATWMCLSVYANTGGAIKGKVLDGFGVALEGVSVRLKGTETITDTDANGFYKINYRLGAAEISFVKAGYTNILKTINVTEITNIDLKPVTLWKYPSEGGMYLLKKDDYLLIDKSHLLGEREGDNLKFTIKGEPAAIPWKNITILDYDEENSLVSGKDLYKVYENNILGIIGTSKFPLTTIKDQYIKVVNNVGVRIINLEPGRYFYYPGTLNTRTRKGEGYFFEVNP